MVEFYPTLTDTACRALQCTKIQIYMIPHTLLHKQLIMRNKNNYPREARITV